LSFVTKRGTTSEEYWITYTGARKPRKRQKTRVYIKRIIFHESDIKKFYQII